VPPLLEIRNLAVDYGLDHGEVHSAVRGVDLVVEPGKVTALVGESGSGKSTIVLSTMDMLPPNGKRTSGEILFQGEDLLTMDAEPRRQLLGDHIAMVPENPVNSLDPLMRVGRQVAEVVTAHREITREVLREQVIRELTLMQVPEAAQAFDSYPHELAGGMVHRVMLAIATILRPKLLIADEPTSGFDVVVKAQILDVLANMKRNANLAMLMVTHDMGAVVQLADSVAVMYAGRIAEVASVEEIFRSPRHPYTAALIAALDPFARVARARLPEIPGAPADLSAVPGRCPFLARCPNATEVCLHEAEPNLRLMEATVPSPQAACYNPLPAKA
jgi:oligopeptide/dipeptide ABC transporter ATP-binding protein